MYLVNLLVLGLTDAAQALLVDAPDEFSTQITPGQMCVTARLKVMALASSEGHPKHILETHRVPD